MWYCIIAKDSPNSLEQRIKTRQAHLVRLQEMQRQGRILLAGPFPAKDTGTPDEIGYQGSLIIAEFDSLTEAQQWIKEDIYFTAGVYQSAEVYPFIKALPE